MQETEQGLTKTYNHLENPKVSDTAIVHLRDLQVQMDRAVMETYGWDLEAPCYTEATTEEEKRRVEVFEDEVIDRLFVLNAERAEKERLLGVGASAGAKKKKKGRKKDDVHIGQGSLF